MTADSDIFWIALGVVCILALYACVYTHLVWTCVAGASAYCSAEKWVAIVFFTIHFGVVGLFGGIMFREAQSVRCCRVAGYGDLIQVN